MEPRQGGRFHIWHMLTREMPFCNLCASKDGTFERENCAPKRPARFRGLDLASAISSAPETITRPFLTAARMYILAKPVSLWTKRTAKRASCAPIGTQLRNFRRQNKQKPRSRWAGGSKQEITYNKSLVTHAKIQNYVIHPRIADEHFPSRDVRDIQKIR